MEQAYVHLLHLLAGHPEWLLTVVFLAAFLESVAVIGTFVPGSTAMFLAGALTGTGSLSLGWVLAWAIAGAIAGDGLSFWIGSRYKSRIVKLWPFSRHPEVLEAGYRFFGKHGAKSVVLARFAGPLRAIVPVVAGMLGMSPVRFYAMNVLSALLWAPAHILPGVVFGASVLLAGAVSFRLVVILALLVASIWLSYRAAAFLLSHAHAWSNAAGRHLGSWACRHPGPVGRVARRLLDPEAPDATSILAASLIVLICGALFFGILEDVISGDPLTHVDQSVYRFMQSVRTPWGDSLLAGLATLGSTGTLAALIVAVALWMAWERRWRTVGYWLAAVLFSQLLIFALQLAMQRAAPNALMTDAYVFPSNHVAATVIVYGFLAFLLARRVGMLEGLLVVTASTLVVIVVALAGVYFGRYWVSDAIGGAALAYVWVAIVALTAILRHPQPPPARRWMPAVMLVTVLASVGVQSGVGMSGAPAGGLTLVPLPLTHVTQQQWTDSVWKQLPCYRSDMGGDRKEPLTLQWVSDGDTLRRQLREQGWIEGTTLSVHSLLSLASPDVPATALPVLPKLNNGVPSSLVFMRPGDTRNRRDVLRFWPSGYAVDNGTSAVPLWIGSIAHERLSRASWPLNLVRVDRQLSRDETGVKLNGKEGVAVLATVSCRGVPVSLLAAAGE
ncbi:MULTISPECIES: bifunctional DedA family/phosphatase PAP2 family protein [Paraburkholderia]|uniref:Membrane protein DedA with SNARE-associated domain/membrane-associated phospholipid phosphatase n=1 Tax=Paraburkholderia graminis TaxID=60548 RepID=A0ABD5CL53_9BURK|nr:bifunctional DedA family/phosphatase PAP2 family protein [Paraburkholderia graminis]MDQ0624910.1 membrane protein DedA with SNARE-associated domain/membrane-associated phospholipid phosphatase [Paraburkholderia graminis]MDR6206066.1 membrane protein DedA with SNARE-associated domain/membrane-associated phospholipid phosphatase [Paraburkholderia graminis]